MSVHHRKTRDELRYVEDQLYNEGIFIRTIRDIDVPRPYGLVSLTQPGGLVWYAHMSDQHADARLVVTDLDPRG